MAISVKELIEKRETIKERKSRLFDLTTSAGVITVKQPTVALVDEAIQTTNDDAYLIIECTVNPNLKDKSLLDAYGCLEPTDIPEKIFDAGEVRSIARKIMECAGFRKDIQSEIHKEIKN